MIVVAVDWTLGARHLCRLNPIEDGGAVEGGADEVVSGGGWFAKGSKVGVGEAIIARDGSPGVGGGKIALRQDG